MSYIRPDPVNEGVFYPDASINTTEVSLYTRFAYKEKFVEGEFERLSLGSDYPIVEIQLGLGLQGVLDGDYNYKKLEIAVSDDINMGVYGHSDFRFTAGKIYGQMPFPLLEIHSGNETFFYDQRAFNLMNFFEFISDEYATLMFTHHFDGFFLNKIPLMQKLKWREVVAFRTVAGRLDERHKRELVLPNNIFALDEPYVELGAGIENIFKIIRIDGLWRLNYLDNPDISEFGLRGTLEFRF